MHIKWLAILGAAALATAGPFPWLRKKDAGPSDRDKRSMTVLYILNGTRVPDDGGLEKRDASASAKDEFDLDDIDGGWEDLRGGQEEDIYGLPKKDKAAEEAAKEEKRIMRMMKKKKSKAQKYEATKLKAEILNDQKLRDILEEHERQGLPKQQVEDETEYAEQEADEQDADEYQNTEHQDDEYQNNKHQTTEAEDDEHQNADDEDEDSEQSPSSTKAAARPQRKIEDLSDKAWYEFLDQKQQQEAQKQRLKDQLAAENNDGIGRYRKKKHGEKWNDFRTPAAKERAMNSYRHRFGNDVSKKKAKEFAEQRLDEAKKPKGEDTSGGENKSDTKKKSKAKGKGKRRGRKNRKSKGDMDLDIDFSEPKKQRAGSFEDQSRVMSEMMEGEEAKMCASDPTNKKDPKPMPCWMLSYSHE